MLNRNGDVVSAQISVLGELDLSKGNFKPKAPVCLKNEGDTNVALEVRLMGMGEGAFIKTTFYPGWNPEIIVEIKGTSLVNNRLLWGY